MAHAEKLTPADRKLREMGFDPQRPALVALEKLRELRGRPGADDLAIARALGGISDTSAARMLAEMESGATGRIRREIRRSLFRLHQRGIEPPVIGAPSEEPADTRSAPFEALLSEIDIEGARIVWLIRPRPQGGIIRLAGLIAEQDGLLKAGISTGSRRDLRAEREEFETRSDLKLVEADWRLADYTLLEAYRQTPEDKRPRVGNFLALRSEFGGPRVPEDFVHPIYEEFPHAANNDPPMDLLKESQIFRWEFRPDLLRPHVEALNRANESVIVLNRMQQQDRVNEVVDHAIGELLSGESGTRIRRRFEDTAYIMARAGQREAAGWAASAAAAIRSAADLKRVPFFRAFISQKIGTRLASERAEASAEPHLIMTPAEAMRAQQERLRRR